jgi:hypothetical protein
MRQTATSQSGFARPCAKRIFFRIPKNNQAGLVGSAVKTRERGSAKNGEPFFAERTREVIAEISLRDFPLLGGLTSFGSMQMNLAL